MPLTGSRSCTLRWTYSVAKIGGLKAIAWRSLKGWSLPDLALKYLTIGLGHLWTFLPMAEPKKMCWIRSSSCCSSLITTYLPQKAPHLRQNFKMTRSLTWVTQFSQSCWPLAEWTTAWWAWFYLACTNGAIDKASTSLNGSTLWNTCSSRFTRIKSTHFMVWWARSKHSFRYRCDRRYITALGLLYSSTSVSEPTSELTSPSCKC